VHTPVSPYRATGIGLSTRPFASLGDAVNKSELIDELAERFDGNRKVATHALESVVDVITRSVATGEKVVITGFGAFERTVRRAGTARNPRTGESVTTRDKFVTKFRPGSELKGVVSGARKTRKRVVASLSVVPATAATAAESATRAAATGLRTAADVARGATPVAAARKTTAKKTTAAAGPASAKKASAKKTSAAKKSAGAKKTAAKKTTTKKATAKKAPAKKTTAAKKSTAKKTSAAKKTTAKKTSAAKKSTAKKTSAAKKSTAKKAPAKKTTR
jgi:DNA-binding protein HU-beta